MNKPTKEELKSWDKLLQEDGLGMDRAYNSTRLTYGFEDGNSLIRTWDSVKIYTTKKCDHLCVVCGEKFVGRSDAITCSRRCRRELQHIVRKQRFNKIKGLDGCR